MAYCEEQQKLSREATNVLGRLVECTQEQIAAIRSDDRAKLDRLDRHLELLFGEKERAFGALNQHRHEHGC